MFMLWYELSSTDDKGRIDVFSLDFAYHYSCAGCLVCPPSGGKQLLETGLAEIVAAAGSIVRSLFRFSVVDYIKPEHKISPF